MWTIVGESVNLLTMLISSTERVLNYDMHEAEKSFASLICSSLNSKLNS